MENFSSKNSLSKNSQPKNSWPKNSWSRRHFLKFMGNSTAVLGSASLVSCASPTRTKKHRIKGLSLSSGSDELLLAPGLNSQILIKEGEKIGKNMFFGTNNDYTSFYSFPNGKTALWVNHEDMHPMLVHGRTDMKKITPAQLKHERNQMGGSFFEIKQNPDKSWSFVPDSPLNFVVNSNSKIKLSRRVRKSKYALGTLANCSGGYTPWGTILTCEENYDKFYGEVSFKNKKRTIKSSKRDRGWSSLDPRPPEHYGWVVEVDPKTKSAEKLVPLGRFAHECATVVLSEKGYPVVYSGDDSKNECLYKFVSDKKNSLKSGTLYAANLEKGEWISLDYNSSPTLKKHFTSQTDVYVQARKAAHLLGATSLDRPEDIEIDPISKGVFVTLTNNTPKGNFHGSILKIIESDPADLTFKHETFRAGGVKNGFSCPDNMAFDKNGNLWITSDISGGSMGKAPYKSFGHNGLFVIPRSGADAGKVIKVASAPKDAELTGPFFSPDQKTLFLSVQHPGEKSKSMDALTSNWPEGLGKKPLSAVVTLQGELLERLTQDNGLA